MQKNVRTKLLNDYSQLGFKGKSTCVKYRYDYNGVTVNLYFDAFDPDSNTLTMILSSVCSLSNLFFRFHTTTLTEACSNELKQHHL